MLFSRHPFMDEEKSFLLGCEPPLNIIDFNYFSIQKLFNYGCCLGYISLVKHIYDNYVIFVGYEIFKVSCLNGQFEIMKWLYELNIEINIHLEHDYLFIYSCENGYLDIAKWLFSLNETINIHEPSLFFVSCERGQLEILKWLHEFGGVDIYDKSNSLFDRCCIHGYLDIIKWFCEIDEKINIHMNGDMGFYHSCLHGHLDVAKWLYNRSLYECTYLRNKKIDIHMNFNSIFLYCFNYACFDVIEWLIQFDEYDNKMIKDVENKIENGILDRILPSRIYDFHGFNWRNNCKNTPYKTMSEYKIVKKLISLLQEYKLYQNDRSIIKCFVIFCNNYISYGFLKNVYLYCR